MSHFQIRPSSILDIIHSGENLIVRADVRARLPTRGACSKCGYVSSMETCKACLLLEGLNRGLPKLGVGKSAKTIRQYKNIKVEDGAIVQKTATRSQNGTNDGKTVQNLDFWILF